MMMDRIQFADREEGRYDRHQLISWWDQQKLAEARVIVAGAGALGNEVLKLLALIGIGHVILIDFDVVALSNLARMILFRESDVGRSKAEVAVERLKEINPEIEVAGIHGDLRFDIGLGDYRAADIVFGCLDSVNARWALNRKCMQAGVDWIDGGISDHHGLLAHYSPHQGACYECNFTADTLERFNRRYSCPFGLASDLAEDKVPTTALTTSMIAAMQVQQALLYLHGNTDGLHPGERLMVYLKPFQMLKDRLPENPECLAHVALPREVPILGVNRDGSIREALAAAQAFIPDIQALSLPFDLVTQFSCGNCGGCEAVYRPKEKVYQHEGKCPSCGADRQPTLTNTIAAQEDLAGLTLQQIGIPRCEILSFATSGDPVYFQIGSE